MPGHGFDARVLAAHFGVEQVVCLKVEHASGFSRIDAIAPLRLLLPSAIPFVVVAAAPVPARVKCAINQLIRLE